MRKIIVTGNLASDAEVLTGKNGENYIRCRLGNHEYGDGEKETRWYDIVMFGAPKITAYLKKGTGVVVTGKYKDGTYESEKYGVQINRNITAEDIDFWNSGSKRNNSEENEAPVTKTEAAPAEAPKSPAPKKTAKKTEDSLPFGDTKSVSTMSTAEADDDLPF